MSEVPLQPTLYIYSKVRNKRNRGKRRERHVSAMWINRGKRRDRHVSAMCHVALHAGTGM